MDIASGLASLKTALDLAKGIKATKDLIDNSEVNMKIIELMEALVDAKAGLIEAKSQVVDKDKLIMELQGKLETKESIFYKEPFYWKDLGDGKKDGAFCQKCYDGEEKLVRLISKNGYDAGSHHCSVCDNWFGKVVTYQYEETHEGAWL